MQSSSARLVALALALTGCAEAGADAESGTWRVRSDTVGDTIITHTISGSARGSGRLVEELRIGAVEGEEHETFGRIAALEVTPSGDILVYDAQVPALRRFDACGRYLGTIGRGGSGPGEYRNVTGVAVLSDGRIVVNDFGNGRFNVYDSAGGLDATWTLRPAVGAWRPVPVHHDGVFVHDMRSEADGSRREVLVRLDAAGNTADTLDIPHAGYRPPGLEARTESLSLGVDLPFAPQRSWTTTHTGDVVSLLGDRYAVDVRRNDGSVLRITRDVAPVPVTDEERAAEEARIVAFFRQSIGDWRWDGPPIPAVKPPVSWVHAGRDGRLWVVGAQPGMALPEQERTPRAQSWIREPVVFDVFDNEGRFLGPIRAPDNLRLRPHPVFAGDTVWAVLADEMGVEYVARLRFEAGE